MKKFLDNARKIFESLPLILSDTYDAKDISINRLAQAALLATALGLIHVMVNNPALIEKLTPVLQQTLTLLGVQLGANVIKRGIDTMRQIKTPTQPTAPTTITKGDQQNGQVNVQPPGSNNRIL